MTSSQALATLGTFGLGLVLFLSIRSTLLNSMLGGLARIYRIHHLVAWASCFALIVHIAIETLDLGRSVDALLSQFQEPGLISAWIATVLLATVMIFGRRYQLPHRLWRRIHLISLVAWGLLCFHIWTFTESTLSLDNFLGIWNRFMTVLGSLAIVRSQIWTRLPNFGKSYRLSKRINLNRHTVEITLSPAAYPPSGRIPSQSRAAETYYVRFYDSKLSRAWHPFTNLSTPGSQDLIFAVKELGRDSHHLPELQVGTRCQVDGPFGALANSLGQGDELWIVAGIGVTPLLSWSRHPGFGNHKICVIHCVQSESDDVYASEWVNLTQKNSNIRYQLWASDLKGNLSENQIRMNLETLSSPRVFLFGPTGFIQFVKTKLMQLGVRHSSIETEDYFL